ncbi:MAG: MFS transporter [Acidimicrobiia bacterium]|nr:MFS transporter [Acidimicrobiia bacterium]MDH4305898.1 MFS transporter [Acidimicrobiia bacterium]MDH5292642.1 MFS transporter [Acidimicrobiia bacterium]
MATGGVTSERPVATLLQATLSIVLGALPIFLTGAMAVFIRPELGFGESELGALATLYYVASASTTIPGGRLAERLGGPKAMAAGAALSMLASLGIAGFARSWAAMAVFLVIGGIANGVAFPASNLAIARGFPLRRQGVGFAIKQSAGPYATLLAGIAVPAIGLTIGWRWAFALAGVAAIPIVAGGSRRETGLPVRRGMRSDVPGGPVWMLSFGAFCAVNASASLGAFYVESAVSGGLDAGVAGLYLSAGSGIGVLIRVGWGLIADRHRGVHFGLLTAMLAGGAVAFAAMGRSWSAPGLFFMTLLVFGTAWAWPSLLNFAVVTRVPDAPGIASGILGAGQFGGGILGPLTFGVIVERAGYSMAWAFGGVMVALAAVFVAIGGRMLERRQA